MGRAGRKEFAVRAVWVPPVWVGLDSVATESASGMMVLDPDGYAMLLPRGDGILR